MYQKTKFTSFHNLFRTLLFIIFIAGLIGTLVIAVSFGAKDITFHNVLTAIFSYDSCLLFIKKCLYSTIPVNPNFLHTLKIVGLLTNISFASVSAEMTAEAIRAFVNSFCQPSQCSLMSSIR